MYIIWGLPYITGLKLLGSYSRDIERQNGTDKKEDLHDHQKEGKVLTALKETEFYKGLRQWQQKQN